MFVTIPLATRSSSERTGSERTGQTHEIVLAREQTDENYMN